MDRSIFGIYPQDWVVGVGLDGTLRSKVRDVIFWDAPTGGTQIIDLQSRTGEPVTGVTSNALGQWSVKGPPFVRYMWADSGGSERELVVAYIDVLADMNAATGRAEDAADRAEQLAGLLVELENFDDGSLLLSALTGAVVAVADNDDGTASLTTFLTATAVNNNDGSLTLALA